MMAVAQTPAVPPLDRPHKCNRGDHQAEADKAEREKRKILEEKERERRENAVPHLTPGTWICDGEVKIVEMIGRGGFGQIYKAVDRENKPMAVKTGPRRSRNAPRMILEQFLVQRLGVHRHFPEFYRSGRTETINYIVMELLGPNIHDLRKQEPTQRFSVPTAYRVGAKMVRALQCIHFTGYLHRDVKPSNMCVDRFEGNEVLLVDFGLSRRYLDNDGQMRRFRSYASFRGTSRYASPRVHMHQEHTIWDDLWSLAFSVVELVEGRLPWRGLTDAEQILHMKRTFTVEQSAPRCPRSMKHIFAYLQSGQPHQRVNYDKTKLFFRLENDSTNAIFDWQVEETDGSITTSEG